MTVSAPSPVYSELTAMHTDSSRTFFIKARNLSVVAALVNAATIALLVLGLFIGSTVAAQTLALVLAMLLAGVLLGLSIASLLACQKGHALVTAGK